MKILLLILVIATSINASNTKLCTTHTNNAISLYKKMEFKLEYVDKNENIKNIALNILDESVDAERECTQAEYKKLDGIVAKAKLVLTGINKIESKK